VLHISPARSDRGTATAETAVLLPVLVVVLAACVWVLAGVSAQLACVDAARASARSAARGEAPAAVRATAARLAPAGAVVQLSARADTVEVRISAEVRPFGTALRVLPALPVSGRATAATEPGRP
jgi:Flp pilus assembly protein TadG